METLESIQNRILSEVVEKSEYIPTPEGWLEYGDCRDSQGECGM